ncbi:MAG: hypothetical protein Q3962_01220 [Corynebacterium sp.]|nr:hypothetical protein [Corynebacterium sp.]
MLPTAAVLWIVLAVALAVVIILWAYFTAQRLHRLHIRTDAARASLEAALNRRGAVIATLHPELASKARAAEAVGLEYQNFDARIQKERELLDSVPGLTASSTALDKNIPAPLAEAQARVLLTHRFYDAAVTDTRALRTRPLIRLFHLGGTAKLPEYFEL